MALDIAAKVDLDWVVMERLKEIAPQRWVLEHGHCCRPDQYGRIKNLGVLVTAQFHPYLCAQPLQRHPRLLAQGLSFDVLLIRRRTQ